MLTSSQLSNEGAEAAAATVVEEDLSEAEVDAAAAVFPDEDVPDAEAEEKPPLSDDMPCFLYNI